MNEGQTYPTKPNSQDPRQPCDAAAQCSDLVEFARRYTRERPGVVAPGA